MAGVEVHQKGQIVALPFRVEKLRYKRLSPDWIVTVTSFLTDTHSFAECSFDAKWASEKGSQLDLDLTCCTFSKTPC